MLSLRKLAYLFLAPLLSGLALSLLLAALVRADPLTTLTVNTTADEFGPGANCSLREAIRSANQNITFGGCAAGSGAGADTIVLPAGTYTLTRAGSGEDSNGTGDLDITSTVIISGAGAGLTFINANSLDRALDVLGAGVTISGVTIRNGRVTGGSSGGGLDLDSSSTVTLSFSTVYSHSADNGGGLRNAGGQLILDNATIYSNTATTGNGGGVRNENGGVLTITNSVLYSNTAFVDGGGLYMAGGTANVFTTTLGPANHTFSGSGGGLSVNTTGVATFTNVSVVSNTASGDGGGGRNLGVLAFNQSLIHANAAISPTGSGSGGGLINQGGQLALTDVTVSDNLAAGTAGGGGLRNLTFGVVTITHGTFTGNQATNAIGNGGAILNSAGRLTIDTSLIGVAGDGNSSGANGGGLDTGAGTTLTLTNSSVISNTSGDDGGGLDASGATLYIANTSFISNTIRVGAVGDGGALRSDSDGVATLISLTVSGNVAENGGGLVNIDSVMTILSSTIRYNTARNGHGGGIDNRRETGIATLIITGTSLYSNSVTNGSGGGIRSTGSGGSASANLDNSTISYNWVVNGSGGGIRNESGSTLRLANVTLTHNDQSGGAGDGISNIIGGSLIVHNALIANNDAVNCAGALTSLGFNLDSGNSCLLIGSGDLTNTIPALGPLQDNGGPTWSQALLNGSAGINQGDVSGCTAASGSPALTIDQRGFTRPSDARCDIGAVEVTNGDVAVSLTNQQAAVIPGTTITYTLLVSNTGAALLMGVGVMDSLPVALSGVVWSCSATGGSSCPASGSGNISATITLAGGGQATFVMSGVVAATATGTLMYTPIITAPLGYDDPLANNTATDADPLTPQADVGVTNSDGLISAIPGMPLTYTIVVTSAGPSAAPNTLISDTFPAELNNVTWTCAASGDVICPANGSGDLNVIVTLTADSQLTFIVTSEIDPAATGTLTNEASLTLAAGLTSIGAAPDSAQDVTTLIPTVDLGIAKSDGRATVRPGDVLTYTVLVSNTGPSRAVNATLTDTFPAQITNPFWNCIASVGSTCPASGSGHLNATILLAPNGALTVTITGTVALTATGPLTNTAYVSASPGVSETGPLPNSAADVTTIAPFEADLTVTTTGPLTATPGAALAFTLAVRNAGPDVANSVSLTDMFPAMLSNTIWNCVTAGGAVCPANGVGHITTFISLPVSGAVTFTIGGDMAADATGVFSHTATATPPSDVGDPWPDDNQATLSVALVPQGDLSVSLTDGQNIAWPGDTLTYTLIVTNPGPSLLAGARVTDTFPANLTDILWDCSASAGSTCPAGGNDSLTVLVTLMPGGTATFIITTRITIGGLLTNVATVAAPPAATDPDPANNTASDVTLVSGNLYLPLIQR